MRERSDKWFGTPLEAAEIKRRSIHGAAVTLLRRIGVRAMNFGATMILARLLVPGDFGLVAMTAAVIGIAGLLSELTLSNATIRFPDLTHGHASNAFWIKIGITLPMVALVALLAPWVADYYGDPRVRGVAVASSLGFVLNALGSQHTALLRRSMQFAALARIEILSTGLSIAVSLIGATHGAGYWALIGGSLTGAAASSLLLWWHCDWRPSLPAAVPGTGQLLRLALRMSSYNLLAFVAGNLSSLIIGRSWGSAATAQYVRANGFQGLMLHAMWEPVDMIAGPAMVQLSSDPQRMCSYYYKLASLSVMTGLPVAFAALALPAELVSVVFGPQWREAGHLLRLLAIGMLPSLVCHTAGWANDSVSSPVAQMWWGLIGWGAVIVATLLGAHFGVEGMALANSVMLVLVTVPCLLFAFHGTPLRLAPLARALTPPIVAALIAAAASVLLLRALDAAAAPLRLAAGLGLFLLLYVALLLTVFGQRRLIVDTLTQLRPRPEVASRVHA